MHTPQSVPGQEDVSLSDVFALAGGMAVGGFALYQGVMAQNPVIAIPIIIAGSLLAAASAVALIAHSGMEDVKGVFAIAAETFTGKTARRVALAGAVALSLMGTGMRQIVCEGHRYNLFAGKNQLIPTALKKLQLSRKAPPPDLAL